MFKLLVAILLFIIAGHFCSAQQVRPSKSSEIFRDLKTLQHIPKVLYLAAHPDDENTGLLSWLVNDQNVETAYLSITRGDGGQNLLGTEQGAALGLIRTHELLEARKLDGAKQFFTRAIDFGFSKNTDDTFKQWNLDSLTADAVWVIRQFRPDVIICRFPPTSAAGHGQHAASAIIAEKAFLAAGDKTKFPNQLKYVGVWQPKRLLWNTYRFGSTNTTAENQLKIPVGQYDPNLGLGYGELAGLSRSLHKSQGAGTPSNAGVKTEYFTLVAGSPFKNSLFDDLDSTWKNLRLPEIETSLNKIIGEFDFNQPDLSLPALLLLRKKMSSVKNSTLRNEKKKALDRIILSCAGFMGEIVTGQSEGVAGQHYNFKLTVISRTKHPVVLESINWLNQVELLNKNLYNDSLITLSHKIQIPQQALLTEPYWLKKQTNDPSMFVVPSDTLIGLPEQESELNAILKLKIGAENFVVKLPLSYKKLDPVKGDVVEQFRIVPAVEIGFSESVYFVQDQRALAAKLRIKSTSAVANGKVVLKFGEDSAITTILENISLRADEFTTITLPVAKETLSKIQSKRLNLQASFFVGNQEYNKTQHLIQYAHLPVLQYFTDASALLLNDDIQVTAKNVGYIPGAGDLIPEYLTQAGIQVDVLGEADVLNPKKLATYDAIVTGVRVINTEKRIKNWQTALKAYVENGGTMVMQYNTTQDMALQNFGVYPFRIDKKRVTEENAPVKILNPDHRLLNYPNKIAADDFKGWIQERGAYFADTWDKRYETLFAMNDTGEERLYGATLYAKYGKGHFIYTPLSFFRQLPVGNVGATRLFFNFISAGK